MSDQTSLGTYMAVNAVLGKLVGHDASPRVINQDVQPVRATRDLVGSLLYSLPIAQITLQPDNLLGYFFSHLFLHSVNSTINNLLGKRENEELANAFGQECMRAAIANSI